MFLVKFLQTYLMTKKQLIVVWMYESLQTKSIPKLYTLNQSIESSLQFVA